MSRKPLCSALAMALWSGAGCQSGHSVGMLTGGIMDGDTDGGDSEGTESGDGTDGADEDGLPLFDVAPKQDLGGQPDLCKVGDDMDAVGSCEEQAPPDSFEPDIQWSWTPEPELWSTVTPMVANLTDDNEDGEVDLCDVPDVVVALHTPEISNSGFIYVLDGATGHEHFSIQGIDWSAAPALGDIDDDGLPEIVASLDDGDGNGKNAYVAAFEHDGTPKWVSTEKWSGYLGGLSLADLDNDGDVEIIAGNRVFDHLGTQLWVAPEMAGQWPVTTAADLDGDEDLEVILGHAAYHHDGTQYYLNPYVDRGYPQVADLDADDDPEVLVTNGHGISMLEHTGSTKYKDLRPTGDGEGALQWIRPATVHDFDGDGESEFAVSSANHYTVYERDASIVWSTEVSDLSGIAAGTAFDFLGDGIAEAMYADESNLFVFDGEGAPLMTTGRSSGTGTEYPVVVDVDNDGSAEILVVSNPFQGEMTATLQVVRDAEDRWIQARRIWNQHDYRVTNVREDGTIPQFESPHWKALTTFRTNAQIEGGAICKPEG